MTLTSPLGPLCSVASLLAITLYQGNLYMNHKLWNIGSSEGCIRYVQVYHREHEIKHTIYTGTFISYLDLHIELDIEDRLRTKLYEKRDDFNFRIVNFPFICSKHFSSTFIWSKYLSVDLIFQSLWFLSGFP
jgi:hypothetical protein